MSKRAEMIGLIFGHLLVIRVVAPDPNHKDQRLRYECECSCGSPNCKGAKITTGKLLRRGTTRSCGAREHGHTDPAKVQMATYLSIYRDLYDDGNLTIEQFIELSKMNCYYCDTPPNNLTNSFKKEDERLFSYKNGWVKYSGLDAVDPSSPHNLNNVVPACIHCNEFKLALEYEEFLVNISKLNREFKKTTVNELFFVQDKVKKFMDTGACENKRAKSILGKLFPCDYGDPYGALLDRKVRGIIKRAEKSKRRLELSKIQIAELIMADCIYCGRKSDITNDKLNTIDRYENFDSDGNKTHYEPDNCVPACMSCNTAKRQLSVEKFREWIARIQDYLPKLPKTSAELLELIETRNNNNKKEAK